MKTTVKREKCIQNISQVMKKVSWVLGAVSLAETGVDFTAPKPELLEEALQDAESAMEHLQEVIAHLTEATNTPVEVSVAS